MVKHTEIIRRLLPTNCLSVFDHFVGLALKELSFISNIAHLFFNLFENSKTGVAYKRLAYKSVQILT